MLIKVRAASAYFTSAVVADCKIQIRESLPTNWHENFWKWAELDSELLCRQYRLSSRLVHAVPLNFTNSRGEMQNSSFHLLSIASEIPMTLLTQFRLRILPPMFQLPFPFPCLVQTICAWLSMTKMGRRKCRSGSAEKEEQMLKSLQNIVTVVCQLHGNAMI